MPEPIITVLDDADTVARRAADMIVDAASLAIRERGRFTLVLAGGSTPEKAYALLAGPEYAGRLDWSKCHLYFGDERVVPQDDPRSNFAMVKRSLLDRIAIPPENVVPIPTDRGTAAECAAAFESNLRAAFAAFPRFDLTLLGLGDDGHTASLFPGKPSLSETESWAVASSPGVLPPPVDRVTMTFPVLNAARAVLFLVTGEKKADVVHKLLNEHPTINEAPAAGVVPTDGTLTWLLDRAAAAKLK